MVTVRHLFFEQTQTIVIIGRKNDAEVAERGWWRLGRAGEGG